MIQSEHPLLPSLHLPDLDGQMIDLSSYANKKLIVFMWSSW